MILKFNLLFLLIKLNIVYIMHMHNHLYNIILGNMDRSNVEKEIYDIKYSGIDHNTQFLIFEGGVPIKCSYNINKKENITEYEFIDEYLEKCEIMMSNGKFTSPLCDINETVAKLIKWDTGNNDKIYIFRIIIEYDKCVYLAPATLMNELFPETFQ